MARKSTESETRKETISYRVTRSCYNKIVDAVNASGEASLSDYARNALLERIKKEEPSHAGKSDTKTV